MRCFRGGRERDEKTLREKFEIAAEPAGLEARAVGLVAELLHAARGEENLLDGGQVRAPVRLVLQESDAHGQYSLPLIPAKAGIQLCFPGSPLARGRTELGLIVQERAQFALF